MNQDRFRLGAIGIVGLAYRTTLQGLRPLLGVSAGLLVPPTVLLVAAAALVPRNAAIVNGVVTGGGSPLDLIVVVPLALLLALAGLLALGACSGMIAGMLLGRPLAWPAALRMARSRLPALVAVAGLLLLAWLVVSAVALPLISFPLLLLLPLLATGGPEGFVGGSPPGPFGSPLEGLAFGGVGLAVTAAVALFALRFLVALPAAALERLGTAGAALRYAVAVTRGRVAKARLALAVGVVLLPELLARGGTALTAVLAGGLGLADPWRLLLHDVPAFGIRVGMLPFQVATLTVAFLNGRPRGFAGDQPPLPGEPPAVEADLDRIAAHLGPQPAPLPAPARGAVPPAGWGTVTGVPPGRGRRPVLVAVGVLVVVALALPGVLSAGSRVLNPRGFAVLSDRPLPQRLRGGTAEATLTISAGLPLAVIRDGETLSLLACEDRRCQGSHRVEVGDGFVSASAATMGGTASPGAPVSAVAVATWHQAGESRLELRLLTCTAGGCGPLDRAPLLDQAPVEARDRRAVAVAARPDGGLVVAVLAAPPGEPEPAAKPGAGGLLRLLFCADARCADPRAVTVARGPDLELTADRSQAPIVPPDFPQGAMRRLAVTVSPDGRAAAALDTAGGDPIVVATCDSPDCAHPLAARIPVESGSRGAGIPDAYLLPSRGIDIALPAGRGPLITTEAPGGAAAVLLVCRTPACAATDRITLADGGGEGPDAFPVGPAAVELDRQGRPLLAVAGERHSTPEAVLVACDDGACRRRTTVSLGEINSGSPVGPLDLALDDGDRPAILWAGPDDPTGLRLRLLTCDTTRCRS